MFDVLEAQRKGDRRCRILALCGEMERRFSKGSSRSGWIWEIVAVLIVYWMKRQILLEQKLPTTPEAMKQTFAKMPRSSLSDGDGNAFSVGQSAVEGVGAEVDGGARAERALDRQEPAKGSIASMRERWRGWHASIRSC
jgi:hypothetical protein